MEYAVYTINASKGFPHNESPTEQPLRIATAPCIFSLYKLSKTPLGTIRVLADLISDHLGILGEKPNKPLITFIGFLGQLAYGNNVVYIFKFDIIFDSEVNYELREGVFVSIFDAP